MMDRNKREYYERRFRYLYTCLQMAASAGAEGIDSGCTTDNRPLKVGCRRGGHGRGPHLRRFLSSRPRTTANTDNRTDGEGAKTESKRER